LPLLPLLPLLLDSGRVESQLPLAAIAHVQILRVRPNGLLIALHFVAVAGHAMHKAKTHLKHGVAFPRHQDTPKYQRQKLGKQSLKTSKNKKTTSP